MRSLIASVVVALLAAAAVSAHMKPALGSLVDLLSRAEVVVIGTVVANDLGDARRRVIRLRPERVEGGELGGAELSLDCPVRVEIGRRYLFAAQRRDGSVRCMQPAGVVLPCPPDDEARYLAVASAARRTPRDEPQLRRALIDALPAHTAELRHHAAFELQIALHDEHRLDAAERARLREALASPRLEVELRALLLPASTND